MVELRVETWIAASAQVCFDLARDVGAHLASTDGTEERVVEGRTQGLFEEGEEVTWEAVHFGVRQRMTVRVVEVRKYSFMRDRMVRGAFKRFEHDHLYEELPSPRGGTMMVDVLRFSAPYGVIGWLVERVVLRSYMRRFLEERARVLKEMAEERAKS